MSHYEQERKLFVRGLNKSTEEDQLKQYFENYGNVVDCNIMRDQEKRSRGFGFILFDDTETIDKVIAAKKDGTVFSLDEHTIEIKRALPKIPRGSRVLPRVEGLRKKVFVGGLPSTITEEDIKEYFESYGRVNEVQLIKDRETGRSRGFAFLTFDDEDSADKCLQRRAHEICKKVCEVKRAETKPPKEDERYGGEKGPNARDPRQSSEGAGGGGTLGIEEVNRLIQQAFAMGQGLYQQPSVQPVAAPSLASNHSTSVLLQALAAPQVAPEPAPVPVANTSALSQLSQLLQAGAISTNSLGTLMKPPQVAPVPTAPVTSVDIYSTPYQTYGSQSPKYITSKDEYAEKRTQRAYRPY